MKYDIVILKLEKIIENWYDKDDLHSLIAEPHDGLCDNIKDNFLRCFPNEIFDSWSYFNGDYWYPVDGGDEYAHGEENPYSLFDNPKRLHLAVHMLQWFRFNNV